VVADSQARAQMTISHLFFEVTKMNKQHNTATCIMDKVTSHQIHCGSEWDH